jgi:glycosyltransferase involved in cell wall biosynthesis
MTPRVSIVTTVYDRLACLARCLRAVQHSEFHDYEQIVVSDAPGAEVEAAIDALVAGYPQARHLRSRSRANDWGYSPAVAGLLAATGDYVCFLSDDNAYLPDHFAPLVAALDADPDLGFVYSSCLYAGRKELRYCPPVGAGIDLGQPLFRRSVLCDQFPHGTLPARGVFSWDWELIYALMAHDVRWQHVDATTFIFRLEAYPQWMQALA